MSPFYIFPKHYKTFGFFGFQGIKNGNTDQKCVNILFGMPWPSLRLIFRRNYLVFTVLVCQVFISGLATLVFIQTALTIWTPCSQKLFQDHKKTQERSFTPFSCSNLSIFLSKDSTYRKSCLDIIWCFRFIGGIANWHVIEWLKIVENQIKKASFSW